MHKNEAELQKRIEQLEQGEPVEACLDGLDPSDAEIVALAASLGANKMEQPADVTRAQRKKVVSLAQETLVLEKASGRRMAQGEDSMTNIWRWFSDRLTPAWSAAVAFVFLAAVLIGLWAIQNDSEDNQEIVFGDRSSSSVPEGVSQLESGPAVDVDIEDGGEEVASSSQELFVPIMTNPLVLGPDSAALRNARGVVEVGTVDGAWRTVRQDTLLAAGERVRTAAYSGARLEFFDGSQTVIGASSEIGIEQLNALLPEQGFRTVVLNQQAGVSDHVVRFRNDAGSLYEVKTATGSGIARGTLFRVDVNQNERASFTVREGRVDVANAGSAVSVVAGQTTSFNVSGAPSSPSYVVTAEGEVTQVGDEWIIAGQPFAINGETTILGAPQVGDLVIVEAHSRTGLPPIADLIQLQWRSPGNKFSLTGPVEEIGDESWLVAGQTINITAESQIDEDIEVGDSVRVRGIILVSEGELQALSIEQLESDQRLPFEFAGVVQSAGEASWEISGIVIVIDDQTEVKGIIGIGDLVKVEGWILEDGSWLAREIKLLDEEGSRFEFVGELLGIDPWWVGAITFEVRDWTLIDAGVEVGEQVRVSGVVLEDGTWVAERVELVDDKLLQLIFVGTVDSIDPWQIAGLPIDTDENTVIDEGIVSGDLVKVTVWILADGSWLAQSIELLDSTSAEGCVVITAVITGINGDQISLSDGQQLPLGDEIIITGDLKVGAVVAINACVNEEGEIEIISITVIYDPVETPPDIPPGEEEEQERVTLCHKPGTPAEKTKSLPASALYGHLGHGDTRGACP